MKKLQFIQRNEGSHWVGDGFPVRNIFSYDDIAPKMSPFLMLDYAGPVDFPATEQKLGVGEHPHRGFETVTIVYDGEVEHRDSSGGGGKIGPGDVQWMTAASGLVHEEFHGRDFARRGGRFEMVQLWVNLPKKDKMSKPGYQGILSAQIPNVSLEGGFLRIIAGEYAGEKGPARTFTPMNVWDIRLDAGAQTKLEVPAGHTSSFLVLKGEVKLPDGQIVREAELAVFEREGHAVRMEAGSSGATVLYLGGEPIEEPIAAYGPFVMNTEAEIRQAILDFKSGKMGRLQG